MALASHNILLIDDNESILQDYVLMLSDPKLSSQVFEDLDKFLFGNRAREIKNTSDEINFEYNLITASRGEEAHP